MIISLIGFMGAGKTTIGRKLATALKCQFIDLDEYIEEKEGKTISEIFSGEGEGKFRKMEENYLQDILEDHISVHPATLEDLPPFDENETKDDVIPQRQATLVLSLGGGAVTNPVCCDLLTRFTYCIYIKCDIETILKRLSGEEQAKRPLLNNGKSLAGTIEHLYREREPIYLKLARKIIG